ncbi:hypothetical protein ROHU_001681 [Labeo rohita]|uniref:Uncharacterized protein n=1 Tax=Labeo rohita TaxID=84645 RepID=A0A498P0U1_LABRO|nr:hypothetical protein ROHU_001681 [Labeo rohita]
MMSEKATKVEEATEQSQVLETRSIASASTNRSRSSAASIAAAKARAKLEAARAKAEFLKQESEILIEKAQLKVTEARMEASLAALRQESEVAAALAEAKVLEAVAGSELGERISDVKETSDRTRDYVMHQSQLKLSLPEPHQSPIEPIVHVLESETPPRQHRRMASDVRDPYNEPDTQNMTQQPQRSVQTPCHKFQVPPFTSSPYKTTPKPSFNDDTNVSEVARYLARRELINSGLFKFDDRPENYWAWKSSFVNAIEGLHLSATEQLDLLSKWLGEQSSYHVRRIRAVHTSSPDTGLRRAWERLEDCYGSPEIIEKSLFDRMDSFPKVGNRDVKKLRELGDLLQEVESAKQEGYLPGLFYLDTARGVAPIVEKLPYSLQEKWMTQGSQYKIIHQVAFPPFSFFCDFVCREARTRNDPSFALSHGIHNMLKLEQPVKKQAKSSIYTHKTEVLSGAVTHTCSSRDELEDVDKICPIHKKPHPLRRCRGFRSKPLDECKTFLREKGVCYRCCATTTHMARDCKASIQCKECGSEAHIAALHPGPPSLTSPEQGGERGTDEAQPDIASKCTEVCGSGRSSRSCSKIYLAKVYPEGRPEEAIRLYVVLDDQSNRSLARSEFFNLLHVKGECSAYTLRTCAGVTKTAGRRATGFIIESLDGAMKVKLPTLIECNNIPDDRDEILTPDAALWHTHLKPIAHCIPPLDPGAQILLLLGRDILQVHKAREQRNGPSNAPYAQRLDLGWVVVGDVCLGSVHRSASLSTYRTHVLDNGRPSLLPPCPNKLRVREKFDVKPQLEISLACDTFVFNDYTIGDTIFERSKDDNKVGLSIEDRYFLEIMDREMFMDESNSWVAPLPFRTPRKRLPNNREQVLTRLTSLLCTLEKKPEMKSHFVAFMQNIFDRDHAEVVPPL